MSSLRSADDSKRRAGFCNHTVYEEDLMPGDHIYSYRCFGVYSHHGIYTGENGQEVIHFSGTDKKSKTTAVVQASTLEKFLYEDGIIIRGATQLRLVSYGEHFLTKFLKRNGTAHCIESKPAYEVLKKAKHYLRYPGHWDEYDLLDNNCESFAFFCKTGQHHSSQALTAMTFGLGGVADDIADRYAVTRQTR